MFSVLHKTDVPIFFLYYPDVGVMAGVTQKNCMALFPLWSLKKPFFRGGDRTDVNQQKHTENLELRF